MNNTQLLHEFDDIESIECIGDFDNEYVYDISMNPVDADEDLQTVIVNDILVHNSNYLTFDLIFESMGIKPGSIDEQVAADFIVYFMQTKMDPIFDKVLTDEISKRNGKSTMKFELETVGSFGIYMAKKKYVFQLLWKDGKYIGDMNKLKSTGLELVQRSTPGIAKNAIKTFINMIFANNGKISADRFYSMCSAFKRKIADIQPEFFAKNTSINKYDDYVIDDRNSIKLRPKCPYAIRGAAKYNYLLHKHGLEAKYPSIRGGMRAKTYYDISGEPFSFPNDIDFPHEFAPKMSIDIQVEKLVFAPVKRLVSGGMISGDLSRMGNDKIQGGFASRFTKK